MGENERCCVKMLTVPALIFLKKMMKLQALKSEEHKPQTLIKGRR
jgi:hypothetical protein